MGGEYVVTADHRVVFSGHARDRWHDRVLVYLPPPPITIGAAWGAGIDAAYDHIDGGSRLHPGTETILIHEEHRDDPGTRIVTSVYYASPDEMRRYCTHCVVCDRWVPRPTAAILERADDPHADVPAEQGTCKACTVSRPVEVTVSGD